MTKKEYKILFKTGALTTAKSSLGAKKRSIFRSHHSKCGSFVVTFHIKNLKNIGLTHTSHYLSHSVTPTGGLKALPQIPINDP